MSSTGQVNCHQTALIPPTQGIRAKLSTTGSSRVVIGGDVFQEAIVRRDPEMVALTSPRDATGLFELQQQPEMLLPFEGLGVDTTWESRMPRASNPFDYKTIADVLITIEYTALHSYTYYQQVIQTLKPKVSADRAFSFRHELSDQWYDLHHPELVQKPRQPMAVTWKTRREDFPPNLESLNIDQVVLYFAWKDDADSQLKAKADIELETKLEFTKPGALPLGGEAKPNDGVISTRRGNAGAWSDLLNVNEPFGKWTLTLPNKNFVKNLFKNEDIEDILFVITYSGRTPAWPS